MNILGLHCYSHDAGAALSCSEQLFASPRERLTGKAHDCGFPLESLHYVMESAGIDMGEIHAVICCVQKRNLGWANRRLKRLGWRGEIVPISHNDALAAAAYYTSPFDETAVLVTAASGSLARWIPDADPVNAPHELSAELYSSYIAREGKIFPLNRIYSVPGWSVGSGAMCAIGAMMAGFSRWQGGKLFELAALSARNGIFPDCRIEHFENACLARGDMEKDPLDMENLEHYSRQFFGGLPSRNPSWPIRQVHCELAMEVKRQTTHATCIMARGLHKATGARNLCIGGEPAINAVLISTPDLPFESIFMPSAATYSGIPLGAALFGRYMKAKKPFKPRHLHPFLGKTYSDKEILDALNSCSQIQHIRPRRIWEEAADLLAQGKICGCFIGAAEYGPYALGNRSILADPRDPAIKLRLDEHIKRREPFRPYAASILSDDAMHYFRIKEQSPFSLTIAPSRPSAKKKMPALVHADGTTAIQTVSRETHKGLHNLLMAFKKLTGIPALLNTSFNRSGEPTTESPRDALASFLAMGLDFLILENHIVLKKTMEG